MAGSSLVELAGDAGIIFSGAANSYGGLVLEAGIGLAFTENSWLWVRMNRSSSGVCDRITGAPNEDCLIMTGAGHSPDLHVTLNTPGMWAPTGTWRILQFRDIFNQFATFTFYGAAGSGTGLWLEYVHPLLGDDYLNIRK